MPVGGWAGGGQADAFWPADASAPAPQAPLSAAETPGRGGSSAGRVEAATAALGTPDDTRGPRLLAEALDELAVPLLEHLSFEEQSLAPVLNSWLTWPLGSL